MEMKINPKILIVTPTAAHKDYCLEDWAKSINSLTYENLDILILDNSENKEHVKELSKYKFRENTFIVHVEKTEKDIDIRYLMTRCNELSRRFAINKGYDYILSIESDVFAPCKNAVEILLSHRKDVVGFDYFIGQIHESMPVVSHRVSDTTYYTNDIQNDWLGGMLLHDGNLKEVVNLGLGFILISRAVFANIPFRTSDTDWHISNKNKAHADTFFHIDLQQNGIPIYCDTSYICTHRNSRWSEVLKKEKNRF